MLLMSARSRPISDGSVAVGYDGSVQDFDCGTLRISICTGPLYGFRRKIGDLIVAGESCFPIKESENRSLEERALHGVPIEMLLGDHILLLVVIDPAQRVVTIAHSMASWRPCYWSLKPGSFTCSTSVSWLKETGHEVEWDSTCTPEYLMYRFVAPPRSILRGIRKLAGGQVLVIDLEEWRVREGRRWHWPDREDVDHQEGFTNVLRARVEEWGRCFPSAGVLLSGGLDSSLLAGLVRGVYPAQRTFSSSFSFANPDDLEDEYALSMARHLGVVHQIHSTTSERYLTGWVESIFAAEEPVHHLQSVLLHLLFQDRAAAGLGAILCGEGADCIVGNASHEFLYRYRAAVAILRATRLGTVWASLVDALGWHGHWTTLFTRRYDCRLSSVHHFLWLLGRYGDHDVVRRILSCNDAALLGERPLLLDAYHDRSLLDQVTALSLLTEGHATISIWGKLAEASGIYLVCPYTSPSVLEASMSISWDVKLREKKHLVRASLRQLGVPEDLIARSKLSFGFPPQFWASKGALFQPIVDMALESFDSRVLESLQREGKGASAMALWCLLNQFLWMQLFEVGRSVEDLSGEILDRRRTAAKSL